MTVVVQHTFHGHLTDAGGISGPVREERQGDGVVVEAAEERGGGREGRGKRERRGEGEGGIKAIIA